jgi:hypothetical protein
MVPPGWGALRAMLLTVTEHTLLRAATWRIAFCVRLSHHLPLASLAAFLADAVDCGLCERLSHGICHHAVPATCPRPVQGRAGVWQPGLAPER